VYLDRSSSGCTAFIFSTISHISLILSLETNRLTADYNHFITSITYRSPISNEYECIILVCAAHPLDYRPAFLPGIISLLPCATLLRVRIRVHGQYLVLNVRLDELETPSRSRVVRVNKRLAAVYGLQLVFVTPSADDVILDVFQ
jgi:hypothetical protein